MVHIEDELWNVTVPEIIVYRLISCKMIKNINVISGSFSILFEVN